MIRQTPIPRPPRVGLGVGVGEETLEFPPLKTLGCMYQNVHICALAGSVVQDGFGEVWG
jgi:hypothetical protein